MREAQEVIYHQLVDSLIDELKPKGILQEHLVLKIANSLWRYRRVINAETARTNRQLESAADDIRRGHFLTIFDDPDDFDDETAARHKANLVGSKSVPPDSYRESLQYYEMRLDRQLTRAYRLLQQLQNPQPPQIPKPKHKNTQNEPISTPPVIVPTAS